MKSNHRTPSQSRIVHLHRITIIALSLFIIISCLPHRPSLFASCQEVVTNNVISGGTVNCFSIQNKFITVPKASIVILKCDSRIETHRKYYLSYDIVTPQHPQQQPARLFFRLIHSKTKEQYIDIDLNHPNQSGGGSGGGGNGESAGQQFTRVMSSEESVKFSNSGTLYIEIDNSYVGAESQTVQILRFEMRRGEYDDTIYVIVVVVALVVPFLCPALCISAAAVLLSMCLCTLEQKRVKLMERKGLLEERKVEFRDDIIQSSSDDVNDDNSDELKCESSQDNYKTLLENDSRHVSDTPGSSRNNSFMKHANESWNCQHSSSSSNSVHEQLESTNSWCSNSLDLAMYDWHNFPLLPCLYVLQFLEVRVKNTHPKTVDLVTRRNLERMIMRQVFGAFDRSGDSGSSGKKENREVYLIFRNVDFSECYRVLRRVPHCTKLVDSQSIQLPQGYKAHKRNPYVPQFATNQQFKYIRLRRLHGLDLEHLVNHQFDRSIGPLLRECETLEGLSIARGTSFHRLWECLNNRSASHPIRTLHLGDRLGAPSSDVNMWGACMSSVQNLSIERVCFHFTMKCLLQTCKELKRLDVRQIGDMTIGELDWKIVSNGATQAEHTGTVALPQLEHVVIRRYVSHWTTIVEPTVYIPLYRSKLRTVGLGSHINLDPSSFKVTWTNGKSLLAWHGIDDRLIGQASNQSSNEMEEVADQHQNSGGSTLVMIEPETNSEDDESNNQDESSEDDNVDNDALGITSNIESLSIVEDMPIEFFELSVLARFSANLRKLNIYLNTDTLSLLTRLFQLKELRVLQLNTEIEWCERVMMPLRDEIVSQFPHLQLLLMCNKVVYVRKRNQSRSQSSLSLQPSSNQNRDEDEHNHISIEIRGNTTNRCDDTDDNNDNTSSITVIIQADKDQQEAEAIQDPRAWNTVESYLTSDA